MGLTRLFSWILNQPNDNSPLHTNQDRQASRLNVSSNGVDSNLVELNLYNFRCSNKNILDVRIQFGGVHPESENKSPPKTVFSRRALFNLTERQTTQTPHHQHWTMPLPLLPRADHTKSDGQMLSALYLRVPTTANHMGRGSSINNSSKEPAAGMTIDR